MKKKKSSLCFCKDLRQHRSVALLKQSFVMKIKKCSQICEYKMFVLPLHYSYASHI